jgi:hypothetical protein
MQTARRLNPLQARWALFFTRFSSPCHIAQAQRKSKPLFRRGSSSECVLHSALPNRCPRAGEGGTRACYLPSGAHLHPHVDLGTHIPCSWRPRYRPHHSIHLCKVLVAQLGARCHPLRQLLQMCPNQISLARSSRETPSPSRALVPSAIDYVTDVPTSDGFTTVMVVVDRFSKSCRCIPLSGLPTALSSPTVAPNSCCGYGKPSWRSSGKRQASHLGTGLSPTGRWRGPTRIWGGS